MRRAQPKRLPWDRTLAGICDNDMPASSTVTKCVFNATTYYPNVHKFLTHFKMNFARCLTRMLCVVASIHKSYHNISLADFTALSTALLFMVLTIEFYGPQLIATVFNVMPCLFSLFRVFTPGIRVNKTEIGMKKIFNLYGCSFVHFKFNFQIISLYTVVL